MSITSKRVYKYFKGLYMYVDFWKYIGQEGSLKPGLYFSRRQKRSSCLKDTDEWSCNQRHTQTDNNGNAAQMNYMD